MRTRIALIFLVLILVLPTGCGSSGNPAPGSGLLPSPDKAEQALFVAAKTYEAAVIAVNTLYHSGKISEPKYLELVAAPDSVANRARRVGQAASVAIVRWRESKAGAEEVTTLYNTLNGYTSELLVEVKR